MQKYFNITNTSVFIKKSAQKIVFHLNNFAKRNKNEKKIELDNRSKYLRSLILRCLFGGGRGHMGSAMSLVEILRVLYDRILKFNPKNNKLKNRDRLILSKGHGCLALYASDKKFIKFNELDTASKFNSILGGHPHQK